MKLIHLGITNWICLPMWLMIGKLVWKGKLLLVHLFVKRYGEFFLRSQLHEVACGDGRLPQGGLGGESREPGRGSIPLSIRVLRVSVADLACLGRFPGFGPRWSGLRRHQGQAWVTSVKWAAKASPGYLRPGSGEKKKKALRKARRQRGRWESEGAAAPVHSARGPWQAAAGRWRSAAGGAGGEWGGGGAGDLRVQAAREGSPEGPGTRQAADPWTSLRLLGLGTPLRSCPRPQHRRAAQTQFWPVCPRSAA